MSTLIYQWAKTVKNSMKIDRRQQPAKLIVRPHIFRLMAPARSSDSDSAWNKVAPKGSVSLEHERIFLSQATRVATQFSSFAVVKQKWTETITHKVSLLGAETSSFPARSPYKVCVYSNSKSFHKEHFLRIKTGYQ